MAAMRAGNEALVRIKPFPETDDVVLSEPDLPVERKHGSLVAWLKWPDFRLHILSAESPFSQSPRQDSRIRKIQHTNPQGIRTGRMDNQAMRLSNRPNFPLQPASHMIRMATGKAKKRHVASNGAM